MSPVIIPADLRAVHYRNVLVYLARRMEIPDSLFTEPIRELPVRRTRNHGSYVANAGELDELAAKVPRLASVVRSRR